jgi:hypothetical protein
MRRVPRKRKGWLITWESSRDDYLADLKRPRVIAILKAQYQSGTIRTILPILFTAESQLTFSEKLGYSFGRRRRNWLREEADSISCGDNPWIRARLVKDLYVEHYDNTIWRQTLHWTEYARYKEDPDTFELVVAHPERQCAEDVSFDMLWYGRDFLREDEQV